MLILLNTCLRGKCLCLYLLSLMLLTALCRIGNCMEAHKKMQQEESRREAEADGKSEIRQLAAEMAELKQGDGAQKCEGRYMHPFTWMACAQAYALACSITAAGPVSYENIQNHMTTVARVHARTGSFAIAMRYDTMARGKWESRTGLDMDDFDLDVYVKSIDEEVLTTVSIK